MYFADTNSMPSIFNLLLQYNKYVYNYIAAFLLGIAKVKTINRNHLVWLTLERRNQRKRMNRAKENWKKGGSRCSFRFNIRNFILIIYFNQMINIQSSHLSQ
jgi:hypothetical protein